MGASSKGASVGWDRPPISRLALLAPAQCPHWSGAFNLSERGKRLTRFERAETKFGPQPIGVRTNAGP